MKQLLLVAALAVTGLSAGADATKQPWEDPAVNAINRLPARTYAMPLADEKAALTDALEPETPYARSLNGTWKLSWAGDPALRVRGFEKPDYPDADWFDVTVPGCVELQGFGSCGYTNVRYPHAKAAPRILDRDTGKPNYNPVSSYRTTFTVPAAWQGRRVILRFDGVGSAYYVWVNGRQVGYAEDSKLPSEFDITPYLNPFGAAKNVLAVEVYRWCDGSYFEDQDMFRYSGIFRDVTLWSMPKDGLWDFTVKTAFENDYADAVLTVESEATSGTLYAADGTRVGDLANGTLKVRGVKAWSAEKPYLYTLVMRKGSDIRARRIGFKEVKIVGHTVLFNGRKIKFKGVNRHETNPDRGRTVDMQDMLRDVTLFKQYNINTVRTCHYPDHHSWYDLCDRYGIYVVAEANVEGHEYGHAKEALGRDPQWDHTIVERNLRNVAFHRNSPSVTFWSMGNETGHGDCFRHALAAVKKADPSRLTHWECGNRDADVDSRMYPTVEWLEARGVQGDGPFVAPPPVKDPSEATQQTPGKAFFMCEYAHAMGNAIGNFQEYWDAFYAHDSLSGGCIWDWVDQAVWKDTGRIDPATGKPDRFLAYGGDFDEVPNDGPFCCNGVVDPFRNVSAKLIEVGHVHRNLVLTSRDVAAGEVELWNRFAFTDANEFDATWELLEDGVKVDGGAFAVPSVPPLARKPVALPKPAYVATCGHEYFYNVTFTLKADTRWAKKGWAVAREQLPYKPAACAKPAEAACATCPKAGAKKGGCPFLGLFARKPSAIEVKEDAKTVTVGNNKFEAVFCRKSGTLCAWTLNGKTILKDAAPGVVAGPRFTCERAFTDNDRWLRNGTPWGDDRKVSYYASGLTQLRYHARPLKVAFAEPSVSVMSVVEVTGSKSAGFTHTATWTFLPCGKVKVANIVVPHGAMPPALPRIGTSWTLDASLENMTYYGRGPYENYVDRKTGSFLGLWESTVSEQYEAYVRPQDCGGKSDVRWVAFTDDSGEGVKFSGSEPLFVQALHYAREDLEFARHRNGDERRRMKMARHAETFLDLDVRQLGLGGASCGPKPMAKYIFPIERTAWTVTAEPYSK